MMDLADMAAIAERAAKTAENYAPEFQGLISHLALGAEMANQTPEGWYYRNYYDLVLREGMGPYQQPIELPEYYDVMEKNACFSNAWNLIQETPDLIYCEGYALSRSIPLEHAWIEEADGSIIDPTWAGIAESGDEAIYFGVRFAGEFALRLSIQSGWASVFQGDAYAGNQILRRGLKMHNGIAIDLNGVGT